MQHPRQDEVRSRAIGEARQRRDEMLKARRVHEEERVSGCPSGNPPPNEIDRLGLELWTEPVRWWLGEGRIDLRQGALPRLHHAGPA
jgi:hypothetical protein